MNKRGVAAQRRNVARVLEVASRHGVRGLGTRLVREAYHRTGGDAAQYPLGVEDIADPNTVVLSLPTAHKTRGTRLKVGWVTTPPALGSGGHTTMFRMIEALEAAGHTCVVILYDRHGGDTSRHGAVIRSGWPKVRGEIRDIGAGFADLDAVVATAWPTAHVVASRCHDPVRFLYLAQDFEPFFYPRGPDYALAEDSYRLGFRCITIGHMVAQVLASEIGIKATVAEFGCDTDIYKLTNNGPRSGIVFYAKTSAPRRGYQLAVAALAQFHQRHPEQPIHVFGQAPGNLPFAFERHDRLRPSELNELYNSTVAGFALSFTNISLVAEEMLAAGTIPVINDSPYARADLKNPHACWARPTPAAMAQALCDLVESPDIPGRAKAASEAVSQRLWRPGQASVVAAVEDEVYGPSEPG